MGEEEKEEEGEGRAGAGRLRAWRSCIIQQLNVRPASFLGVGVCSKLCLWDSLGAAAAALSASSSCPPSRVRTPEASFGDVRAEAPRLSGTKAGRDLPAGLRLQSCKLGTHPSNPGPTAAAARPDSASLRAQVVPAGARPRTTHSRAPGSRCGVGLGWGFFFAGGGGGAGPACPGELRPVLCHQQFSNVPSAVTYTRPTAPAFPASLSNFFAPRKLHNSGGPEGPLPHPASLTSASLGSRGGHLSVSFLSIFSPHPLL